MKSKLLLGTCLCLSAFLVASAQQSSPSADRSASPEIAGHVLAAQAFAEWRAEHGASWRCLHDQDSGYGRFLYGGSTAPLFRPAQDGDYAILARRAVEETSAIHGIDASSLTLDSITFLPLGMVGGSDKMTVRFVQRFRDLEVIGGTVNVLLDMEGGMLSLDSLAIPGVSAVRSTPAISAPRASAIGRALFAADTGLPVTREEAPVLRIERAVEGKLVVPRLVWDAEVHFAQDGMEPEGNHYWIDAATGELSRRVAAIHHDVSGNVQSWVTPGSAPDTAGNPEVLAPMGHLRVTSTAGNTTTDANGNFTIVGASAPLNVTVTYDGDYVSTTDIATGDYSLPQTLTAASGNQVTMNPATTEYYTAEANCFLWINNLRDWTRTINPSDSTCDFTAQSNVNLNSTCNAYYDGVSVNMFRAGGGCPNTGFSSVVVHEMGHWLNDLYGSGNGWDGFGEGNADVYSMYILDDPIVGRDFCGTGCYVRDGNNTRQYCGDGNGGCYGEVHYDGEVLMGALWKVRARLQAVHGTAAGGAIADLLLNSWMNAYDDTQIDSIIETHWLTLDDTDGNVGNGTPNYTYIDGGFTDQGFPGYGLTFVDVTNTTVLSDTPYEAGPYTVSADFVATMNPPLTTTNLVYRVNGGSFVTVPMAHVSGATYTADIPGQASPSKVEYYVVGEDILGNPGSYPTNAPLGLLDFLVGVEQVFYFEDFENGVGGWTHGATSGVDDWRISSALGVDCSFGKAGDPTSAYSGTNIFGTDLGAGGNDGEYEDNTSSWLHSPLLDLSAAAGATLTFQRWLRIEQGIYDQGQVWVNGTKFYENESSSNRLDTSWNEMVLDISGVADGNPSVQLAWTLNSDFSVTFGGWNIDDVKISAVVSTIYASATVRNGSGTNPNIFTSTTLPVLGTSWNTRVNGGAVGFGGTTFLFLYSGMNAGTSTAHGELLLDPTSGWLYTGSAPTVGGYADFSIGVPADPSLQGFGATAQCYMLGASAGARLTNAIDLGLGY